MSAIERLHFLAGTEPATHEEIDAALSEARAEGASGGDGWELGRWWRVEAPDGSTWCETSNEEEAREAVRTGDRLLREHRRVQVEYREEE